LKQKLGSVSRKEATYLLHSNAQGKLLFGIFAVLAEFEYDLISERTKSGLDATRARGENGKITDAKLRLVQAAMEKRETNVSELCKELEITRQTIYRHVSPKWFVEK
jgi:DNA invertase Pin-like site-specific DNA recombinase